MLTAIRRQTGSADDARRQSAGGAAAGLPGDSRLGSRLRGLSEPGGPDEAHGIDQFWVADINDIRLKAEFVYLAVILDGHSRKVVGWSLGRTLTARLAIAVLNRAIVERQPLPGVVHHSDRGV